MFGGFMRGSIGSRCFEIPRGVLCAIAGGVLTFQVVTAARLAAHETAVPPASQGDFGGLVDIGGGRHIYLECRGAGSPTVVLEAGYRSSARVWSEDIHQSGAAR